MLAAGQRLRRRGGFAAATRFGRRAARGVLVVYLNPPPAGGAERSPARVGFVVGRAVGQAVDRNRVRRRLRHLMRERLDDLPPGASVVVRALPGAAARPYGNLGVDLDGALAAVTRRATTPRAGTAGARSERHSGERRARAGELTVTADPPRPTGLAAQILCLPIVAYRRWVSPGLPARCRFYPSCSAYALTAIANHGPVRGVALAIWRLLRCHPFHPGGYDPVPAVRRPERRDDVTGAVTG